MNQQNEKYYVSYDLKIKNLTPSLLEANNDGETAKTEAVFASCEAYEYQIIVDGISYFQFTLLYFCWLRDRFRLLTEAHKLNRISPKKYLPFRNNWIQVRKLAIELWSESIIEGPGLYEKLINTPAILEQAEKLPLTGYTSIDISKFIGEVVNLQFEEQQTYQIIQQVYAGILTIIQRHYPEYCQQINQSSIFLWIYASYCSILKFLKQVSCQTQISKKKYDILWYTLIYFAGIVDAEFGKINR